MKMIKSAMVLLAMFFATLAYAGNVEIGSNGSIRLSPDTYILSNVTVTPAALSHGDTWKQAFKNPNIVIPVDEEVSKKMVSLFYQENTTTAKVGVKYTEEAKIIDEVKNVVMEPVTGFNPFIIFWVILVVVMISINVMTFKGNINTTVVPVSVFVGAAIITTTVADIAIDIAIAIAAGTIVFVNEKDKKIRTIASTVFYIAMIAGAGFMYIL